MGLAAAMACACVVMIAGVIPAAAAPGTPGTPQAPVAVYTENFENGQGATPIQLPDYTGAPPANATYTTDPAYLVDCNGWIASRQNPTTEPTGSGCGPYWHDLPDMAGALGVFAGTGETTNHALGEETFFGPGPNKVVMETTAPVPLNATNRFLTFSVDVAEIGCAGVHSLLQFFLLNGGTAIPTFTSPIEACVNPQQTINGIPVGRYTSNAPVLFSGSSVGLRLVNAQGAGNGNDFAIDNIKILDVTPQLDKNFNAATVPQHGSTTLTYTITNTNERAVKNGWSFTDTLPAGLIANPASATTNCTGGTVSANSGAVSVAGNLATGQAACTATVQVSAANPDTYTNCAANITAAVGVSLPACTSVTFNAAPTVSAGGPYSGQEGATIAIAGTVTDPDGPSLTTAWTIAPASGVDTGASCAFGAASAVSTTVTCTDDDTYTLTLTANDGINADVVATTTLTLVNVAPAVSVSAPANGALFVRGTTVTFTAPFTDAGSNDSHTCTVNFDDGTPLATGSVTETPGSGTGTCATTHAFTALGPHTVLVTVTDDDGGVGTATVRVVIYLPGEAWAISASGVVTIAKTPQAVCPPDAILTQVGLNVPGVANVSALNASCTVNPTTGVTTAKSSVDGASLLGGLISISNIESTCHAGADGVTGSSRVGTINGRPIGTSPGSISIPLVATVFFNQTVTSASGQLFQHAIRVQTLLGQEIILAGCRVG